MFSKSRKRLDKVYRKSQRALLLNLSDKKLQTLVPWHEKWGTNPGFSQFQRQRWQWKSKNTMSKKSSGQDWLQIEEESHVLTVCAQGFLMVHMSFSPSSEARELGGAVTVLLLPQGYIASRMLSRRACYILKMDHKAIPALDQLKRYIYERQVNISHSWARDYWWLWKNEEGKGIRILYCSPLISIFTFIVFVAGVYLLAWFPPYNPKYKNF